jgi:hypothetical protein
MLKAFAILNLTAPTLPFPRVEMAFICALSNKYFPVIVFWSHTDARNMHFNTRSNSAIFPD